MKKALWSIVLLCFFTAVSVGQNSKKADIASVVAAGKVSDDRYANTYFGIVLSAPKAQFKGPSSVSIAGRQARFVDIVYDSPDGANNYTLAVLADSLDNYPRDMSLDVYVRSVRHQLEKQGALETQREEFPVEIAGVHFTGVVLKVIQAPNFGYYRGLYATFMKGYVLLFEVQCRHEERLQQLLSSSLVINPTSRSSRPVSR